MKLTTLRRLCLPPKQPVAPSAKYRVVLLVVRPERYVVVRFEQNYLAAYVAGRFEPVAVEVTNVGRQGVALVELDYDLRPSVVGNTSMIIEPDWESPGPICSARRPTCALPGADVAVGVGIECSNHHVVDPVPVDVSGGTSFFSSM